MNVTALIRRQRGQLFTITRVNTNGSYSTVDGSYVPGDTTTLEIMGSLQPVNAQDIVTIPEGDRTRERYRFYSFPDLLNNDTAKLRKGDTVDVSGEPFRVESVAHWPNHSKSIIARVNTDAN